MQKIAFKHIFGGERVGGGALKSFEASWATLNVTKSAANVC